jgi:hypothetical protein
MNIEETSTCTGTISRIEMVNHILKRWSEIRHIGNSTTTIYFHYNPWNGERRVQPEEIKIFIKQYFNSDLGVYIYN